MIEQDELTALSWLHGKLHLSVDDFNLYYLIGNLRQGKYGLYYNSWEEDGRPIWQPKGELRFVQKAVARLLLKSFPRHPCCYGFSGGSIRQAVLPHTGYRSVLAFDLRHAFSQITHQQVWTALNGASDPYLSFYASRFVADLCMVGEIRQPFYCPLESRGGFLPQGTSTSPRLFDLCLSLFDDQMALWAQRFGLAYSRYADNLFFSSPLAEFPDRVRMILLSEAGKRFRIHKIRLVEHGQLCRMLGLNLKGETFGNTRSFKRAFRGALHHLEYVLEHGLEYKQAWQVVNGYAGFAVWKDLSGDLAGKYQKLKQQIHHLEWGW